MSKGMRTEDEVRDSAKLVLGFDKTEELVDYTRRDFLVGHRFSGNRERGVHGDVDD